MKFHNLFKIGFPLGFIFERAFLHFSRNSNFHFDNFYKTKCRLCNLQNEGCQYH